MDHARKKRTILVADDDPAIIDVLGEFLRELGYAVQTTMDGNTIGEFKDGYPDLILLDIGMSGCNGREICKRLKGAEATRSIPCLSCPRVRIP